MGPDKDQCFGNKRQSSSGHAQAATTSCMSTVPQKVVCTEQKLYGLAAVQAAAVPEPGWAAATAEQQHVQAAEQHQ